jgi:hypothetical protein
VELFGTLPNCAIIERLMVEEALDPPSDPSSMEDAEEGKRDAEMVNTSENEAAQLDLVALISKLEWRHVMNRVQYSPWEAKKKQTITLDGSETTSYPLHLAVSKKPPVRQYA